MRGRARRKEKGRRQAEDVQVVAVLAHGWQVYAYHQSSAAVDHQESLLLRPWPPTQHRCQHFRQCRHHPWLYYSPSAAPVQALAHAQTQPSLPSSPLHPSCRRAWAPGPPAGRPSDHQHCCCCCCERRWQPVPLSLLFCLPRPAADPVLLVQVFSGQEKQRRLRQPLQRRLQPSLPPLCRRWRVRFCAISWRGGGER